MSLSKPAVVVALLFFLSCGPLQPVDSQRSPPATPAASAVKVQPLTMYAAFSMNLLEKVNGVEQSFLADFYLTIGYQEPKLLQWFPANVTSFDGMLLNESVLSGIEIADIDFTNSVDATAKYSNPTYSWTRPKPIFRSPSVVDDPNIPWVVIDTRYVGIFRASIVLADFPYDTQRLGINVELSNKDQTAAVFVINPGYNFMSYAPPLTEWQILSVNSSVTTSYYAVFNSQYSRANFLVTLRRFPGYYINKIVIGVIILVLISSGTFFMDTNMADRAAVAATAYLGVVTYLFIVTQDVPKVPYITRLDSFITMSQWFIFVNYVLQLLMMFLGSLADQIEKESIEEAAELEKKEKDAADIDFRRQLLYLVAAAAANSRCEHVPHRMPNPPPTRTPLVRVGRGNLEGQQKPPPETAPSILRENQPTAPNRALKNEVGVPEGKKETDQNDKQKAHPPKRSEEKSYEYDSSSDFESVSPSSIAGSDGTETSTARETRRSAISRRCATFFLAYRRYIDTVLSLGYTVCYAIVASATLSTSRS